MSAVLPAARRARTTALVLATAGFAVNFWAWGLLSPLGPVYAELLNLTPTAVSILVAVPVVVGSLGRIVLGGLTDRHGGRIVFAVASFLGVVPVLFLAFAASYPALLAGGFLLGLSGATFAIGVPFVNGWYPPHRRGLALGVFGMGNIGTAVSGFATPWLAERFGRSAPFIVVAAALALVGVAFLAVGRDAPGSGGQAGPFLSRFMAAARLRSTRELSAFYALTFGGFVAFGVYLPLYLRSGYGLTTADAAARTAGFVVLATLARPVGGWLSDRMGGEGVLSAVLAVVFVCAVVVAFLPPMPLATVGLLSMAAAFGVGNGAVFEILSRVVPGDQVGSVTGVVGAAGGLGGFLPPIVMGVIYQVTGSYAIGLMLLAAMTAAAFVYCWFVLRMDAARLAPR
ncbi:MFS transporter [Thermostaphylospora chromogena]|uniref:MFS transporter, NNP family, nitrate/nitrite transporter n=1 Tax=Thermostaphylospora chromogena TaxID=35622 RepID=A0A1H1GZY3_9ACTN|nr:MFS transporter [Thermostaphylospora chromogena]SDR18792.1 MFS transporter, NNP family, nitrate/nitrite transporter [Thermostaphylospora chromogena]